MQFITISLIKMKLVFFLFIIYLATIVATHDYDKMEDYSRYQVYEIIAKNEKEIKAVQQIIASDNVDVWKTSKSVDGEKVVLMVPSNEQFFQMLKKFNLQYKLLINNVQRIIDEERKNQASDKTESDINSGISFDKYYRMESINQYLKNLTVAFPNLTEIITIGQSYEGREINLLKISTSSNKRVKKPVIFIDGGFHAREWISPATVLYVIHQLVENSEVNYDLIENVDWYLLPVVNPDGYEFTHTKFRLWRKTRRPINGSWCKGIDANRNFPFHWKECGFSKKPCFEMFPGEVPLSEPETSALANFVLENLLGRIKLYLSFHSYAQTIMYPWAYTAGLPDDYKDLDFLARKVESATKVYNYTIGNSFNVMYCAAGSSPDWFKAEINTKYAYTIELPGGDKIGFILPASKIIDVVTDMFPAIRIFGEFIRDKYGLTYSKRK